MKSILVLGAQWGDEGKGKITNYLSLKADVVVRYQGGNNAGHTIVFNGHKYALSLVPSGIFSNGTKCVLGNGMVINPIALRRELDMVKEAGYEINNLYISSRASVLFHHHIELDRLHEEALKENKIGTTKKGIGPAYSDKINRIGMRIIDFVSDDFPNKYKNLLEIKNKEILSLGGNPIDYDSTLKEYKELAKFIRPYVTDTISLLNKERKEGKKILLEGAQGALLDIDFGTFPYVTSSNVTVGGAISGTGLGLKGIDEILGIVKAYTTRVGEGPFVSELNNEIGNTIREKGHEYGTVTKRPRRTGYLDLVSLKYSIKINGITSICLTLLDVLSDLNEIKICTAYKDNGTIYTEDVPASNDEYINIKAVYKDFKAWKGDISNITSYDDLPIEARSYIEYIEKETGVPVDIVSVGPSREQTIIRKELFL